MTDKILVAYWSGTGNTEMMAKSIAEGIGGKAEVKTIADVDVPSIGEYERIVFGCPSMGAEVLEEDEFEPAFAEAEKSLAGKKVALFGSYGWGEGEWMEDWEQRVKDDGAELFEKGLIINETPDDDGLTNCRSFGERFANS